MNLTYKWKALIVCIAGTFMVLLDTTVVNVALPQIIAAFNEHIDKAQLVVSGYLIALAMVIPATGFLTDRLGIKRLYLFSLAGFAGGSALCGLAWDINSLTFFRILQGLGGGMLMPLSMTIIFTTIPKEEQGVAMGFFGLPLLLAPTIAPTLGGYLVETFGWRIIFYMNVPISVIAIWLTWSWLKDSPRKATLPFDYKGFILAALSFGPSLEALSRAPTWGWSSPKTLVLMGISAVSLVAWVFVELNEKHPLLDLRIYKNHLYSLATIVNFTTTFGLFSAVFLLPLFLQSLRGLGPMETGLLLIPQALGTLVAMPISGRIYDRIGARIPVVCGMALVGIATLQMQFLDINTSDNSLRLILVLRGVGMGMAMMPVMTISMLNVPPEMTSRASALTNVTRQVFASFGTAIFASILDRQQTLHYAALSQTVSPNSVAAVRVVSAAQQGFVHQGMSLQRAHDTAIVVLQRLTQLRAAVQSFDDAFIISGIVLLVGMIPAFLLPSGRPARRARPGPME